MAGFFPQILGLIPTTLAAFTRIMRGLAGWFTKLGDKAEAVSQHAEDMSKVAEKDPQAALNWFIAMYPDIKAVLTAWPRLPSLMYVVHNVMSGQGVDRHTATTAVQLAVNELKQEQR